MGGGQLWTWLGQPVGLLPLLIGTALALALVAAAARPGPADRPRNETPCNETGSS